MYQMIYVEEVEQSGDCTCHPLFNIRWDSNTRKYHPREKPNDHYQPCLLNDYSINYCK